MCGIAGILSSQLSTAELETRIREMDAAQQHRGPDVQGEIVGEGFALGHTRLSIQDLSSAANQPMSYADGAVSMVFNGEIYNYPELREELQSSGHVFKSSGDAEVLLAAYREWGVETFSRLNGMFAAAFYERQQQRLILVRDRLGIKPLHVLLGNGLIAFASEIKALLLLKQPCELHDQALAEYLYFGNALGANTLYNNIERVLPGHYWSVSLENQRPDKRQYWSPPVNKYKSQQSEKQTRPAEVQQVKALLSKAVKRQLLSDVPIGISLSGGIDSTAIAAFATQHSSQPIDTFSIGFDFDQGHNELPAARRIAEQLGTRHHELIVSSQQIPDVVQTLVQAFDEPFADAANIPLYLLYKEIKGQYTVVLQGDGGDELFAGYPRYRTLASISRLRLPARLAAAVTRVLPGSPWQQRVWRYCCALSERDPGLQMARMLTVDHPESECSPSLLLQADYRQHLEETDPFHRYRQCAMQMEKLDPVQRMLMTDLQVILPDIFLEKVDRSAMAMGVEARVPFLDSELVDYVASLSAQQKMPGGKQKALLKLALRGVVPDEVLNAPKKGFGAPYGHWLRYALRDLFNEAISSPQTAGILDREKILQLYQEHCDETRNWEFLLWKCLQLALWLQRNPSHFSSNAKSHQSLSPI